MATSNRTAARSAAVRAPMSLSISEMGANQPGGSANAEGCRGRSKFRPLRRRKMQASSTDSSKGQKALNASAVWDFNGTRSGPVTAAVAGFSSAPWPEFGPPYTLYWHSVSEADLHEALRQAGVNELSATKVVTLEPSGKITVLKS